MLSKRIMQIKEIIEDHDKVWACIGYDETPFVPDPTHSPIIRKAESMAAMCEHIGTPHMPGSRLAGLGSYIFAPPPEYLTPEEKDIVRRYPSQCPPELMTALEEKIFIIIPVLTGHICVDQKFILKHGVIGMLARVEQRLQDTTLTVEQREFLQAVSIQWKGCLRFAQRYSEFYTKLSSETEDPVLKSEYAEIAARIKKVPANPAETFAEALQSMWFVYRCIHMDDSSGHSFGRMDQLLYPYYRHDIDHGILTEEDAKDYFQDFWLKFCAAHTTFERSGEEYIAVEDRTVDSGLFWLRNYSFVTERHVDDGYPINLCGYLEDGSDATNDLSWLVIKSLRELKTFSIKPVVQYTDRINPDFLKECYSLIMEGRALPAIAFEDNTQAAFRMEPDCRYSEEDLRQISSVGCIETAIPGKSYTDAMNCFMNLAKIFEITLFNGRSNGRLVGLELPEPATFEEFLRNYHTQVAYFIKLYTDGQNAAVPFYNHYFMRPITSSLMEDCIEKAQLLDAGGARFWSKAMNCCGVADVADSLAAVKMAVYEDSVIGLEELRQVLTHDFAGNERLRQYLLNNIPKYGNGDPRVDTLAKSVVEQYCEEVSKTKTFNGNYFRPGMYSFYGSVVNLGKVTGALPSGRKAGQVLALNIAPGHGSIKQGMTGALESMAAFDHRLATNACPVDLQLTPDTPVEVLDAAIKFLNNHNATFVQINVVNKDDLIEAQKNPDKYQDLIVRVSGFSARFVVLDKSVQDEIIERSSWS